MPASVVHLPNGFTLTVTPVFGGVFFKANDLNPHHNLFPPGWTIIINREDDDDDDEGEVAGSETAQTASKPHQIHRFRQPTLHGDHLFISSISNPSSSDFAPTRSQTRSIAMMLWATLWWYFHQPEPAPYLTTKACSQTPELARPKGDWRVNINREGIFTGKHLLPKLERMGLIASEDSTVGLDPDDGVGRSGESWTKMFVSRRSFWQLDPRIYLYSPLPAQGNPYPSLSPNNSRSHSRSASPDRRANEAPSTLPLHGALASALGAAHGHKAVTPPGPFTSNSHLPTFYPPPPEQYTWTNHIRHPIRPKPPRQGETFYTRYIPSLGHFLSFRVASLSSTPCKHIGPTTTSTSPHSHPAEAPVSSRSAPPPSSDSVSSPGECLTDLALLHRWMNDPRVAAAWGVTGPETEQRAFLEAALTRRNSFPVIGCFDGRPFGYFEIYWAREEPIVGVAAAAADHDRGLHVLVGEPAFRGPAHVPVWLSALVHYCWLADGRTRTIIMEPRVDNEKLLRYCQDAGFYKEREIALPHKQSNLLKIQRDAWEAPAI